MFTASCVLGHQQLDAVFSWFATHNECNLCLTHIFVSNTTKELRQRHKKNKPSVAINRMVEVIAAAIKTTLSIHSNRNMHCYENCAQTKYSALPLSVVFAQLGLKFWRKVNYPSFSKISKQWAYECRKQLVIHIKWESRIFKIKFSLKLIYGEISLSSQCKNA